MNDTRPNRVRGGFTLLELLVVIGIISMLVGLIAPGLRAVSIAAKKLKQKAVLHSLETGLELFAKDFDGYPDSTAVVDGGKFVSGAQHLVEAMVGRDGRGFDPKTNWNPIVPDPAVTDLYTDVPKSLNRRMGPYIEIKDISARLVFPDLYDVDPVTVYSGTGTGKERAPVFVDIFRHRRITLPSGSSVWVGNPIVYFKANAASRFFRDTSQPDISKWTYNYLDNQEIFKLGTVKDPAVEHRFDPAYIDPDTAVTDQGQEFFYKYITNPKATQTGTVEYYRPYNAKTFILMSAGYDGIFGTKDDVTNFNY